MKNKFEFDYYPKNNNKKLFEYNNSPNQNSNQLDKWSKLESILQRNRKDNYFSNDTISTLNIASLKSMEWDDINNIQTQKSEINLDSSLNNKYYNQNIDINLNLDNLQKLIHPIDDEFEIFIKNKIEELEKLKIGNKNNLQNNGNSLYIINDNLKINEKNINNNIFLSSDTNEEKSIIKEKNEAIFTFNKNDIENNDEYDRKKTKGFLNDYTYNDNIIDNSIFNSNKTYDNNVGKRNKMRLNKLLSRIKSDKKETELINKPNKVKIFDNTSDDNTNLNKIQRRYYEQFREEDKYKNNKEYSKDYFATILYELKQGK